MSDVISLREGGQPRRLLLSDVLAAEIVRLDIASVAPLGNSEWMVSGIAKVGVVKLDGTELRIEPKVPIARLFFLLSRAPGWGSWRDDDIQLDSIDDLYPAIAELFTRFTELVLRGGILRAYWEQRSAEAFIRGRWLVSEQIRKRHGMPLPAELVYDEFTTDVSENRLLRSAARRLLRMPGLVQSLRARLHRVDQQLADVGLLTRGEPLPEVHFDRRNARYAPALTLAQLVLDDASLDHDAADASASGFLLTMSTIFERFVEAEVTRAARSVGGHIRPQYRTYLDQDRQVAVKPDLVWLRDGRVQAVFDAKYKAENPAGFPNADIYQMLAYCVHHQVSSGHLIYAAGNEVPARYVVEEAGVTIVCHAINLDASPGKVMAQVDTITAEALERSTLAVSD